MKIHARSFFRNPDQDIAWFLQWVDKLENNNQRRYQRMELQTSLGKTNLWGVNTEKAEYPPLVIFPGARTTPLIWDLDRGLDHLGPLRIYLVETNGLPNHSDGMSPEIKSLDYGHWAVEIMDKLNLPSAFVAGASFGGLIVMKLAIVQPARVQSAFLLNPGCLQPFSLTFRNLYYNILPLLRPTERNVRKFLDNAIFCKPTHQLSPASEQMLVDYEIFAISRYIDKTQKPYFMKDQLRQVSVDTYLLLGTRDLLFPWQKSAAHAASLLKTLQDTLVLEDVGHGIETYPKALEYIRSTIASRAIIK